MRHREDESRQAEPHQAEIQTRTERQVLRGTISETTVWLPRRRTGQSRRSQRTIITTKAAAMKED